MDKVPSCPNVDLDSRTTKDMAIKKNGSNKAFASKGIVIDENKAARQREEMLACVEVEGRKGYEGKRKEAVEVQKQGEKVDKRKFGPQLHKPMEGFVEIGESSGSKVEEANSQNDIERENLAIVPYVAPEQLVEVMDGLKKISLKRNAVEIIEEKDAKKRRLNKLSDEPKPPISLYADSLRKGRMKARRKYVRKVQGKKRSEQDVNCIIDVPVKLMEVEMEENYQFQVVKEGEEAGRVSGWPKTATKSP